MRATPIDFRAELNDEQFAAVTAPPGPALVLAGAGSGKTRTLTYRVAFLRHQGVAPWRMLLLTFTNKAAKEMLRRVEELTGDPYPTTYGGTFHSVGGRFLRRHGDLAGLKPGFTIMDQSDAEALLDHVVRDLDPKFFKDKDNPKKGPLLDIISYGRNTLRPISEVVEDRMPWNDHLVEPVTRFATAYQEAKTKGNVVDYDDLLAFWWKVLREQPDLARQYQEQFDHILVDEYQDTNKLQAEIVDCLGARHQVMAVGDDAQCIYTWRGAAFENIATFEERHPGTRVYKIETNYRSTPQILQLANSVLASQPVGTGYHKELRAVRRSHERPWMVRLLDTRQQAQFLVQRISALLEDGRRCSDIAILYRAHYQALDAQLELSRQGIPFVITSGVKFFEQAHIRDLVAQLRFVVNPTDLPAFLRFSALLPKVGDKTAEKLFQLIQKTAAAENCTPVQAMGRPTVTAKVPEDARPDWTQLAETLADVELAFRPAVAQRPAGQMNLGETAPRPVPAGEPATPAKVVELAIAGWYGDHLRTVYPNWESRRDDLDSLIGFASRFEDMNELLSQLILLNSETSDRGVEIGENAVRLTTIHQAKGLEFPFVFLIGLADGQFPLKRAIEAGDVEEERRLFYVAVTRARDELYLCYPMVSGGSGPPIPLDPSRFVKALPQRLYEALHYRQRW